MRAAPGLDWVYVEGWAARLSVDGLLERARGES